MDTNLTLQIAGAIGLLILGKYFDRWFTRKPKLVSYIGHVSAFAVRGEKPGNIFTHAVVVVNLGRAQATNVRMGHAILPEHYQVIPTSIAHHVEGTPGNPAEIVIDRLVPGEQVTISYLYFPPLVWSQVNAYTKFDEGFAKIVTVLPTRQFSRWTLLGLKALILAGIISISYWLLEVVRWIISHR